VHPVESISDTQERASQVGRLMSQFRGKMIALIVSLAAPVANPISSQALAAPIPLAKVDIDRMYGGWYIIATIPNGFEKGIVAPYDVYSRRADGDIQEDFYFLRGGFDAPKKHFVVHDWVLPGTNNAGWRVQIFWPVNLPFLVLYVDPNYRYVIFGEEDRQLGWIYSRTPSISDSDYQFLLNRLDSLGYDSKRFVKFIQTPDQIGKLGFWSDAVKYRSMIDGMLTAGSRTRRRASHFECRCNKRADFATTLEGSPNVHP
jgi:apolipoprotein D and lipocalin family protein